MTMLYLRKTKNPNSFSRKIIKVLILIFIIISLNFITGGAIKNYFLKISGLIWQTKNQTTKLTTTISDNLKPKSTLISEIKQLRSALENEKAANHLKTLYLETKYNELKASKNLTNLENEVTKKTALIIAKPPQTPKNSIAIDFNPNELNILNRVYSGDFIIASFSKTENWPIIMAIYGKENEAIKFLLGDEKIPVEAIGKGNGSFETSVPIDLVLNQNEPVYLNNGFGELFGYISSIERSKEGDKLIVLFRSPINLNELNSVEIK